MNIGTPISTKIFYKQFRKCILQDMEQSTRLRESGLDQLLFEIVQMCFAGEPCKVPLPIAKLLLELLSPAHSLCMIQSKGKNHIYLQPWPSWLNKGYKRHISLFQDMFYSNDAATRKQSCCNLCTKPISKSIWYHALYEC